MYFKKDCKKRKEDFEKKHDNNNDQAGLVEDGNNNGDLLHISNGVCALTNSCVVDSGSFHMSPNRHWLHEYKPLDGSYVLMESNISCKTEGINILRYLKSRCLM